MEGKKKGERNSKKRSGDPLCGGKPQTRLDEKNAEVHWEERAAARREDATTWERGESKRKKSWGGITAARIPRNSLTAAWNKET